MVAGVHPARAYGSLLGGRFQVIRRLFAGSSSEVLEARGARGELRAIKILNGGAAASAREARLLAQEGCVLAALDHPHLVKVFDVGVTADGRPYFVMERLFGETLRSRLDREQKLPVDQACAIVVGALSGLSAAHKAGAVHRDIKPSNIFLARSPSAPSSWGERAVVLDFGIAKLRGSAWDTTSDCHIVGTPRYIAPEQILSGRVDARTDVYSMGLVLFEVIAGRSAFDASGAIASFRAHLREKPHSIRAFAEVPRSVERAIDRALQKMPERRWPSADAFADAISSLSSGARVERSRAQ